MSQIAKEFKLWENNPDPGAWVLYGARYSQEVLKARQDQIIGIIEKDMDFVDCEDGIHVSLKNGGDFNNRDTALIEELACVNEALNFHDAEPYMAGYGLDNLLKFDPRAHFTKRGLQGERLVNTYNAIDLGLGQIIKDISLADRQNRVVTGRNRGLLAQFKEVRERTLTILGGKYVIIGLPE